jgi:hypothetical protein
LTRIVAPDDTIAYVGVLRPERVYSVSSIIEDGVISDFSGGRWDIQVVDVDSVAIVICTVIVYAVILNNPCRVIEINPSIFIIRNDTVTYAGIGAVITIYAVTVGLDYIVRNGW